MVCSAATVNGYLQHDSHSSQEYSTAQDTVDHREACTQMLNTHDTAATEEASSQLLRFINSAYIAT